MAIKDSCDAVAIHPGGRTRPSDPRTLPHQPHLPSCRLRYGLSFLDLGRQQQQRMNGGVNADLPGTAAASLREAASGGGLRLHLAAEAVEVALPEAALLLPQQQPRVLLHQDELPPSKHSLRTRQAVRFRQDSCTRATRFKRVARSGR